MWEEIYLQQFNDFQPQEGSAKGAQESDPPIVVTLRRKLQGHWNCFGVIGNSEQTWNFAWFARKLVYKWLNRRSQRKSFTRHFSLWRDLDRERSP
jgi:hypothetical protein